MNTDFFVKEGDWVRKKNYVPFGKGKDRCPVVKIVSKQPKFSRKGNLRSFFVNGTYELDATNTLVISEEEAKEMLSLWEDCLVISPVIDDGKPDFKCVREDNGKQKIAYHGTTYRYPLFNFRMKKPEGAFQAYRCNVCGKVHIGKTKL